ncbi:mago-binding protein, putative [Hepatocystis sp. ex Piliocolobus tephrosceles]|nr:mago-binding protein, putative [Hepatocystis sp. ex Piliocolobus tephrosceles]
MPGITDIKPQSISGSLNTHNKNSQNPKSYIKEVVTPLGDTYIINEKTNEKFIKGTQRSDGTFRKDIRVRPDYMPQEEYCAYQVKGKLLEERNKNRFINANVNANNDTRTFTSNNTSKKPEKKVPGWNPVDDTAQAVYRAIYMSKGKYNK